jgi:glycine hydroxymethyltransferase
MGDLRSPADMILVVCTGNTCRSAMAEALLKTAIATRHLQGVTVRSCGVAASSRYRVPPVVVALMAERGIAMSSHQSTPIARELVDTATVILCMDASHRQYIAAQYPDVLQKTFMFRAFAGAVDDRDIPDPIGQDDAVYRRTAEIIAAAVAPILKRWENTMDYVSQQDAEVAQVIAQELERQRTTLELIASENHTSRAVMEAQGSCLTNKYAEGYPGKRYYGGCEFVDVVERIAIDRAKKIFGAEHVNVQSHSGAQANIAAFVALINIGDTIMGMSLAHGGHLSHGSPANFSGKNYRVIPYTVRQDTEEIDYDEMERLAKEHKPKLIVTGASAYSKTWDWQRIRGIADSVGALVMADVAHYAGLIAAGLYPSPVPYADVVTTTTHKTLRGPRGGMIMCKEKYAAAVDKAVFPGTQGGPLMHVIAAKAVAFGEALRPSFAEYQKQVMTNARVFAAALTAGGLRIVSGGTDCHMFLVDLRPIGVKGNNAQDVLEKVRITVNKNAIPYDPEKPGIASGIRIGTPAITTRGMKEPEMEKIAGWIVQALKNQQNEGLLMQINQSVAELCKKFPLY